MDNQEEKFVSPGYDENLHACGICLDTGISHQDGSYCTCRMGPRIKQIDQFGLTLRDHTFPEAIRIVFTSTMRTEKSLAAAAMAILIAGHQRATKAMIDGFEIERCALLARIATLQANVTAAEARAFEMSEKLAESDRSLKILDEISREEKRIDAAQTGYEHIGFINLSKAYSPDHGIIYGVKEAAVNVPEELVKELLGEKLRLSLRLYMRFEPVTALAANNLNQEKAMANPTLAERILAPTDEQIETIWNSLPGIEIHNKAYQSGVKTEYALRVAFARALLAEAAALAAEQEGQEAVAYGWVNAGTDRQNTKYATLNVGPENPWVDGANAFPVYLHAHRAAQEADAWQPIETSPKDMSSRLYLIGRYCVQGFVDVAGELMVQSEVSPHWRKVRGSPTHWMPLPDAPASTTTPKG